MRLNNYLSDIYRNPNAKILRAILNALGKKDEDIVQQLTDARKELFLTTATGHFLVDLAGQYGFSLPRNSGFDQEGLRKLAIPAIFLPKQITSTFNKIVETFYSRDILHPSFKSTAYEPFNLVDGDTISFETESDSVSIAFRSSQINDLSNVSAAELAGVINAQQKVVFADTVFDRTVNQTKLRISTFAFGTNAKLRVNGGTAQNVLKFPRLKSCFGDSTTVWTITKTNNQPYDSTVTFTYSSGTRPSIWNLDRNDLLTIRGLVDTPTIPYSLLNGAYSLLDVGYDYFQIQNLDFKPSFPDAFPLTFTQPNTDSLLFTSLKANTIYDNQEYALVVETKINQVDVTIPAIPPIITRSLAGAAHIHGTKYSITNLTHTSLEITKPNNIPSSGTFVLTTGVYDIGWERFKKYKYSSIIDNTNTTILNLDNSVRSFPFSNAAEAIVIGQSSIFNPVYASLDSNEYTVSTPNIDHGFERGQEIVISNFDFGTVTAPVESTDGNLLTSDFNKPLLIEEIVNRNIYKFRNMDSNGNPLKYYGTVVDNFVVNGYFNLDTNLPDIEFVFADDATRAAAGFQTKMKVKLINFGTIISPELQTTLEQNSMEVISQSGNKVFLRSGKIHQTTTVNMNAKCRRDAYIGGNDFRHYLSSPFNVNPVNWNRDYWFINPKIVVLDAQPEVNSLFLGSYVFDTIGNIAPYLVASISTVLNTTYKQNEAPGSITVNSVTGFPSSGELFVDYGNQQLEGPIKYYAIQGNGPYQILIDRSYQFKKTHIAGADVRLSRGNQTINIKDDGSQYPFYVTGVLKARQSLEAVLKTITASGIKLSVTPRKPTLRYDDTAVDPFQD